MSLTEKSDWKIIHFGGETRVFWQGHDVSRFVTKVSFERDAGSRAVATVSVLANVELEIEEARKATEPPKG